jgi:hypothetical protein
MPNGLILMKIYATEDEQRAWLVSVWRGSWSHAATWGVVASFKCSWGPLTMVKFPYNSSLVTWHVGPQAKISSSRSQGRSPDSCLRIWVPSWLEPRTLSVVPPSWPCLLSHQASPRGGDVEGLCWHLHRPMICSRQARIQSLLTDIISPHRIV